LVARLNVFQSKIDALKRLQSETADELDALLPSILDTPIEPKGLQLVSPGQRPEMYTDVFQQEF